MLQHNSYSVIKTNKEFLKIDFNSETVTIYRLIVQHADRLNSF
jgi:hypothetical protein